MANQKISARTVLTGTGIISRPAARAGSTTDYRTIDNLSATTDPGTGDDGTQNYHVGSQWFNVSAGRAWMCTDASTGAAVWKRQMVVDDNLAGLASAVTSRSNLNAWARLWKPYKTGTYHWSFGYNSGSSAAVPTANQIYLYPIIMPADVTVSDLFLRVSAGAAGNWQAAIYNADQSTLKPTTLVAKSSASASTSGSATLVGTGGLNTNPTLTEGVLYYFAFNTDVTSPTYTTIAVTGNLFTMSSLVGSTTLANVFVNGPAIGYIVATKTLGTWGDLTAETFVETNSNFPLIGFKVA